VSAADPTIYQTATTPTLTGFYDDGSGDTTLSLNAPTQIITTGMWTLNLTQAQLNHGLVTIKISGSGIVSDQINITTDEEWSRRIINHIESQRASHGMQGSHFVFEPVNGNDTTGDGSWARPYKTITKCLTEAVSGRHDSIVFDGRNGAGSPVALDEQITISKDFVLLRAPGRDALLETSSAGDLITIDANGVEIDGFKLQTHTTGNGNCITINAGKSFAKISNCWFARSRGDGINIDNSEHCLIRHNRFDDVGSGGSSKAIRIKATSGEAKVNIIQDNIIRNTTGDGIYLEGGANSINNVIDNNVIIGCIGGWGIQILAGVVNTVVANNKLYNNADGNINNLASSGIFNNEQWAKDSVVTETRLAELDAANMPSDLSTIATAIGNLNNLNAAQVNTEVSDVIKVDTMPEVIQGVPPTTPTLIQALMYLYQAVVNLQVQTATETSIHNAAGTKIAKSTVSEVGGTTTKEKMVSGV
jgi:hypothetical protein